MLPHRYPTQDWFEKSEAEKLAKKIRDYWAARGMEVRTEVVLVGHKNAAGWFAVRSDMVNGLPIRRREDIAA